MDKGTVRGLIGAQIFNIELPTRSGQQTAEFSPAGLNLEEVRKACDLTPKKPSKDYLRAGFPRALTGIRAAATEVPFIPFFMTTGTQTASVRDSYALLSYELRGPNSD